MYRSVLTVQRDLLFPIPIFLYVCSPVCFESCIFDDTHEVNSWSHLEEVILTNVVERLHVFEPLGPTVW